MPRYLDTSLTTQLQQAQFSSIEALVAGQSLRVPDGLVGPLRDEILPELSVPHAEGEMQHSVAVDILWGVGGRWKIE